MKVRKIISEIFTLLILVSLMMLAYVIFSSEQKEISHQENRWLKTNDSINFYDVKNNELKKEIEDVLKDQFLYRDILIDLDFELEVLLNKPFSKYDDNNVEINVLPDGVLKIEDDYLVMDYLKYSEENLNDCINRAYNINQIKLQYPNLSIYVYRPTTMRELLDPENNPEEIF